MIKQGEIVFICENCGMEITHTNSHMIILKDEIWLSIAKKEDVLCDGCICEKLNRPVLMDDLFRNDTNDHVLLNNWYIERVGKYLPTSVSGWNLHLVTVSLPDDIQAFDAVTELRKEIKDKGKDENFVDINSWLMAVNWCKDFIKRQ